MRIFNSEEQQLLIRLMKLIFAMQKFDFSSTIDA